MNTSPVDTAYSSERPTSPCSSTRRPKLYREAFFSVAVGHAGFHRARRHLRPVSVVLVEVARSHHDPRPVPVTLAAVRGADDPRLRYGVPAHGDRVGLVLEDTAEDGAVALLDRLRVRLAALVPEAVCGRASRATRRTFPRRRGAGEGPRALAVGARLAPAPGRGGHRR